MFFAAGQLLSLGASAQTLEKMNWFNEPAEWNIEGNVLTMPVTPQSDYWRISQVKISGDYKVRFDQAGLMLRIDRENYIKAGIEFVDGKYNISTVVTHRISDWSVITLDKPVPYNMDQGSAQARCSGDFLYCIGQVFGKPLVFGF